MPIYEFYCAECHTIFQFLSRATTPARRPACPRCGRADLERRPSAFAVSKGRTEGEAPPAGAELDDARLDRAMESLAGEAGAIDEEDPRGAARFLRKLYETAGLPIDGGLGEALRRMEAGDDPEAIEEELGDLLDGETASGSSAPGARSLRRRLPPRTDPELHEL